LLALPLTSGGLSASRGLLAAFAHLGWRRYRMLHEHANHARAQRCVRVCDITLPIRRMSSDALVLAKAAVLGVVEGLTEFLPVSSTGHLIVASRLLDWESPTFEIVIQLGAMLALTWAYRAEIARLVREVPSRVPARLFVLKLFIAFLPAAVVGLAAHAWIEAHLFQPGFVAGTLIIGGILIFVIDAPGRSSGLRDLERISFGQALAVGLGQTLSLLPGVSRAGATILTGLLAGLERRAATEFSFFVALPTMYAACLFSLWKARHGLSGQLGGAMVVGLIAAFVTAYVVIEAFLRFVQSNSLRPFGWYRIGVGALVILWLTLAPHPAQNVVLIVSDSLRAQNLGLYGHDKPTSPFLDSLEKRAIVYDNAYSHYSYTWPSISNLFTGVPFSALVDGKLFVTPPNRGPGGGLDGRNRTLAEYLAVAGVATRGVSANPFICRNYGFAQGFDSFHDGSSWDPEYWEHHHGKFTAEEVNQVADVYLDELAREKRPWFLYLHYFDTHMNYDAPIIDRVLFESPRYMRSGRIVRGSPRNIEGKTVKFRTPDLEAWLTDRDIEYLEAQYDAEIHYFDRNLKALFASLERRGLDATTTVIVTADHGEAFFERGFWGHGYLSRAEEEHIPLLIVPAAGRGAPRRVDAAVTSTEIFHAVLASFGVHAELPGEAIPRTGDLLSGSEPGSVAYSEGPGGTRILRDRHHALYRYADIETIGWPLPVRDGDFLFDLATDPAEMANLLDGDAGLVAAAQVRDELVAAAPVLSRVGQAHAARGATGGDPMQDAQGELRERLKALGYAD
jgi:undecaprenyl-diphosphatase